VAKPYWKPVTAFVVLDVAPGEAHNAKRYLHRWAKKSRGPQKTAYVRGAWVVTGDHDVIAMLEADTNKQLLNLVTAIVRGSKHPTGRIVGSNTMVADDSPWGD